MRAETAGDANACLAVAALHCPDAPDVPWASEPRPTLRLFVACEPFTNFWAEVWATGPIAAIESGTLDRAPVGSYLVGDDPSDPDKGKLYAERIDDGWEMRSVAREPW